MSNSAKPYQPVVQVNIKDCREYPEEHFDAVAHPPADSEGVRYAIAQGPSMVPHSKEDEVIRKAIEFNLQTLRTACDIAQSYNVQLITFPELFLTGYEFAKEKEKNIAIPLAAAKFIKHNHYIDEIQSIAVRQGMTVICPMPYFGKDPRGNEGVYDVAMIFKTDNTHEIQFKNHLWGIDERKWFRFPEYPELSPKNNYQNCTNPFRVHLINGFPVGVGICYDAEFPEVARCLALNGSLLTVFPTAAPIGMLEGQTEPYPDISQHYIPANALTNFNFCSYSNRAGNEYDTDGNLVLEYTGNSIICNPYGKAMVAAIANEDCLLIADCLRKDIKRTQPEDTDYLINRRPEIYTVLTKKEVPFPYGQEYVYNPKQHKDPPQPSSNKQDVQSQKLAPEAVLTPENLKLADNSQGLYQPLTPVYGRGEAKMGNLSAAVLPENPIPADSVYQLITNELLMDFQPGLNLATFCNEVYTDPWGEKILHDSMMKNFIDHTEYPGTNLAEKRSIRMIAKELGTTFDEDPPKHKFDESKQPFYGAATIGSSEAVMLGLIAHKFIWNLKHRVLLKYGDELGINVSPLDLPVVLMSSNVHGCWDKFCRYYDAVPLYVEITKPPYAIDGKIIRDILNTEIDDQESIYASRIRFAMGYQEPQPGRTIGELVMAVGACVGTTFTGNSDNVFNIDEMVDEYCSFQNDNYSPEQKSKFTSYYEQEYCLLYHKTKPTRIPELMDIPIHVDAAAAGFVLMFSPSPTKSSLRFNFKDCPKRVRSINTSNHKFGMTFPGMGSVIFKDSKVVDSSLIYHIAYLGGSFDDYTVNFSRGSAMIIMQYYNFLSFGRKGYQAIMDNCVENTRWFVGEIKNNPTLNQYFMNISNYGMTIELPIIALTWANPNSPPQWKLTDMSDVLAQSGWIVPAYNIPVSSPEDTDGIPILRIVVQQVVTRDKLVTLLQNMETAIEVLNKRCYKESQSDEENQPRCARQTKCLC